MTNKPSNETADVTAALLRLHLRASPFADVGVAIGDDGQVVILQASDQGGEWFQSSFRLEQPVAESEWSANPYYDLLACGKAA